MKIRFILCLFIIGLIIFARQSFAGRMLTDSIDIKCYQTNSLLNCNYRTLDAKQVLSVKAENNNQERMLINEVSHPQKNDTIAILFLIDTSDSARQNVINKNKQQIKALINLAKPHYRFGLASFDKTLKIASPVGTSTFLINKSLTDLKAEGLTTELYRNLLKAINHLRTFDAQRKLILLFSDGQAEDKAYFHADVVAAARQHGIIINSIGYPRSVSLSVALQTLRRLSEETAGKYIESDNNYNLPEHYLKNAFDNIDNGGTFSVDLKNNRSENIKLTFNINQDIKSLNVPVKVDKVYQDSNPPAPSQVDKIETNEITAGQTNQRSTAPIQIITRPAETPSINLWFWYGLPAAFIIIIVFIMIIMFLLWHRQPKSRNNFSEDDYKPYAYLISSDGTNTRYPITRTIWRIGRSKDNEFTIDDTSVSRRHAEIHRNSNGTFDIIDMNSMNGIYINNEKTGKAILQEGDIIEVGDIILNFTQLTSDHSTEESTIMQKTKLPPVY